MSLPPGPNLPPLIQTARWFARPIPFMQANRRRYGEAFSVRFAGFEEPMVLVSDPEIVKGVYSKPANTLPPTRNALLEPIMGSRSVLLLEGREHLSRRKLMLPPFHGERMRAYEGVMRAAIRTEMEGWPVGRPFPIHPPMQAVTLEVILRAVFGLTEGERLVRLRGLLSRLIDETESPVWQMIVLLTARSERLFGPPGFQQLFDEVNSELFGLIAERRADPMLEQHEDILSSLTLARFEDGQGMSDEELRDQLITLLLAGHETTATALAWTFDLLLRHPAKLSRLTEEIEAGEEEYLRAVISESLRLRPVIPVAGRIIQQDLEVEGMTLPAGSNIAPSIWMAHTREDVYPEPFAFKPERFLDSPPETYSWIPFGGGTRRCLGASFAEFEMRIVLEEVLTSCELRLAGPAPQKVGRRNITLSPKERTPVVLTSPVRPQRVPAIA